FTVPLTDYVRRNHTRHLPDIAFARDHVQRGRGRAAGLPTVYSPYGRIEFVWLELPAKCYFDWWQAGGVMFNRQTAIEGQRRALVVAPFEICRFREEKEFLTPRAKRHIERFLQQPVDGPAPTVSDLARLCEEPGLDYVMLKENFPGLA